MQRTARCAPKIVAFLNAGSCRTLYRSFGAPPLMPKPLGAFASMLVIQQVVAFAYHFIGILERSISIILAE